MTRLEIGDVLEDRYRIDRPIARGGMSTVYRCVDMRLGRAVAAKVMDERYCDDPIFIKRFSREARAMARLQHPNLVAIHDFSADGEPIYLIMELIDGGTLRELLAEGGPFPVQAATSTLRNVLRGLEEVHSTGLIHRDIKPDNVLITSHHRVKVGDFGLVRATNAEATTNMIVGTVSYLAPEQVTGEEITPASDVYSAGIVLFELLTGTVPFSGDTPMAHATARLNSDVPAPSSRISGVPKLVDALVATATARDPRERFADAGEFLDAIEDICRELDLPTVTIPVPRNAAAARTAPGVCRSCCWCYGNRRSGSCRGARRESLRCNSAAAGPAPGWCASRRAAARGGQGSAGRPHLHHRARQAPDVRRRPVERPGLAAQGPALVEPRLPLPRAPLLSRGGGRLPADRSAAPRRRLRRRGGRPRRAASPAPAGWRASGGRCTPRPPG